MAAPEPTPIPVPEPTPVSRPFWDALAQHRILVQYSPSADRYVFYPRMFAPGTLADDLEWREIDGAATLYTYTVARRPTGPPWVDALPQLPAVVQQNDLDAAIDAMVSLGTADSIQIQRLKKRKLVLRDRIQQLEDQTVPDIIA